MSMPIYMELLVEATIVIMSTSVFLLGYTREYLRYKEQAIPKWYETDLIKQIYLNIAELSKLWGIKLHVDHIIPLQGKNVCDLHCWDNLQLLEASLNQR